MVPLPTGIRRTFGWMLSRGVVCACAPARGPARSTAPSVHAEIGAFTGASVRLDTIPPTSAGRCRSQGSSLND